MKLYVSGPMTWVGPPTWNHPAFHRCAAELRCLGHQVISPAELDDTSVPDWDKQPWDYYLRRDVKVLCDCDGIVLLPDWEHSKGAALELHVAKTLGMRVFKWVIRKLVEVDPETLEPWTTEKAAAWEEKAAQ